MAVSPVPEKVPRRPCVSPSSVDCSVPHHRPGHPRDTGPASRRFQVTARAASLQGPTHHPTVTSGFLLSDWIAINQTVSESFLTIHKTTIHRPGVLTGSLLSDSSSGSRSATRPGSAFLSQSPPFASYTPHRQIASTSHLFLPSPISKHLVYILLLSQPIACRPAISPLAYRLDGPKRPASSQASVQAHAAPPRTGPNTTPPRRVDAPGPSPLTGQAPCSARSRSSHSTVLRRQALQSPSTAPIAPLASRLLQPNLGNLTIPQSHSTSTPSVRPDTLNSDTTPTTSPEHRLNTVK